MSVGQPQPDTQLINNVLILGRKKLLDDVTKHRLDRAVNAYKKHDLIRGIEGRGLYLIYINEPQQAIDYIKAKILQYGMNENFVSTIVEAYQVQGKFREQFETYNLLDQLSPKLKKHALQSSMIYLCNSDLALSVLSFLDDSEKETLMEFIEERKNKLSELGVSIETYQKLVSIVHGIIFKKYNNRGVRFKLRVAPDYDFAEFSIYFDDIDAKSAFDLNSEIDNAVLEEAWKDEKFAEEVRKITTQCTLSYGENLEEEFT